MSDWKKITVIGDIMCEPPLFEQVKKNGGYDFAPVFQPLKGLLSEADYVIGNLETPLAGEAAGYTASMVSFNTPEELAVTLKDLGVDLVSTANNHCTDRGIEGAVETVKTLDRIGLPHTGTYADPDTEERNYYFKLGDTTVAVVAYTVSNNATVDLEAVGKRYINTLKPSMKTPTSPPVDPRWNATKEFIRETTGYKLEWIEGIKLKRVLGISVAYADDRFEPEKYEPFLKYMDEDLNEAKKHADVVLFVPHTGGQFNTQPGHISKYVVQRALLAGADAVFAAHSHTTQMAAYREGKPCFYSLGNVTMWPHSDYSVVESLPEYGIAAHVYVGEGKIQKTSFSLFKMVQEGEDPLRIIPVDELYATLTDEAEKTKLAADVAAVAERICGRAGEPIRREYDL